MNSPPPLSPLQTPEPFPSPAQKVRMLDKSTRLLVSRKHCSFVSIGAVIIFGLFSWIFVESSLLPQPVTVPSVTTGSFIDFHKQIGCMWSLKWILFAQNSKSDTSASKRSVKWFHSSWMKIFLGDSRILPDSKLSDKSCAPKRARMSRGRNCLLAYLLRMQCAAGKS